MAAISSRPGVPTGSMRVLDEAFDMRCDSVIDRARPLPHQQTGILPPLIAPLPATRDDHHVVLVEPTDALWCDLCQVLHSVTSVVFY